MTTYYLRNFVENVSDMPAELARRFKLMREIDEKAHALQAEAEAASRKQLEEAALKVCFQVAIQLSCWQADDALVPSSCFSMASFVTGTTCVHRQMQQRRPLLPRGCAHHRLLLLRAMQLPLLQQMGSWRRICGRYCSGCSAWHACMSALLASMVRSGLKPSRCFLSTRLVTHGGCVSTVAPLLRGEDRPGAADL